MSRRAARENAMKLLYQLEIQKEQRDEQMAAALEEYGMSAKDEEYITDIVKGVFNNLDKIDTLIGKHLKGWKIERISRVELSIFRLSVYEIIFRDDIPYNVSINEAVELAKKYGGEESGAFVNGILSKINIQNST
jgi:transcription antitermination protein NusB